MRRCPAVALLAAAMALTACTASGSTTGPESSTTSGAAVTSASTSPGTPTSSASTVASSSTTVPTPRTLTIEEIGQHVGPSTTRIQVATCDSSGQGSGFVTGPQHVVTAAHVVNGAQVVRVILGTTSTAARVVGVDAGADVALLETTAALPADPLLFAAATPLMGAQVVALGFTRGDKLSVKPGNVTTVDKKQEIDGVFRTSLLEISNLVDQGNSGGPLVDMRGDVVGLIDAFDRYAKDSRLAVSAAIAAPLVDRWTARPVEIPLQDCPHAVGPDGKQVRDPLGPHEGGTVALHTLAIYFDAINRGDFTTGVAQLANPMSVAAFQDAVTSSQDSDFQVRDVRSRAGAPVIWLEFTSRQAVGKGPRERPDETCTRWSQEYVFRQVNGVWLIDLTTTRPGTPRNRPCAAQVVPTSLG